MAKRDNTRESGAALDKPASVEGDNFKTGIESHNRKDGVDAARQTVNFHPGAGMVSTVSDDDEITLKFDPSKDWRELIGKVDHEEGKAYRSGKQVTALLTNVKGAPAWWHGECCEYPVIESENNALRLNTGEIIPLL